MSDFVANRRLYLGAGKYIEKGEPAGAMTPTEREPLLASGAIGKAKPKATEKAEPAKRSDKPTAKAD